MRVIKPAQVELSGHGLPDHTYRISEGMTSIGRHPSNDIVLPDSLVSRYHARLMLFEGSATLVDLSSRNGSRVGGDCVRATELADSQHFVIGPYLLRYRSSVVFNRSRNASSSGPSLIADIDAARRNPVGLSATAGKAPSALAIHLLYRATEALAISSKDEEFMGRMLDLLLQHTCGRHAAWWVNGHPRAERGDLMSVSASSMPPLFERNMEAIRAIGFELGIHHVLVMRLTEDQFLTSVVYQSPSPKLFGRAEAIAHLTRNGLQSLRERRKHPTAV